MIKTQVLDREGNLRSEIHLPEEIFSYPIKEHLLYESIVSFRANQRRGTASTKTRGEVEGSGRKLWRQKGTGRARMGSIRSPLWRKGGTTFGPKPRNYYYSLPKKAKKNAMKSALSLKFAENKMLILDGLDLNEPKTKEGAKLLKGLKLDSVLIVDSLENTNLFRSLQNLQGAKVVDSSQLNVYDILSYKWLVFSERAFGSLVERLK